MMNTIMNLIAFFALLRMTLSIDNMKTVISDLFYYNERYHFKMKVGRPSIIKSHIINQAKEICWFYSVLYDSSLSVTSSRLLPDTYEGDIFSDIFQFVDQDITLNNFPYLLGNKDLILQSSYFGGGYSLPYKFNSTEHSLIHQLLNGNHINYLSYAFILNNKGLGLKIIFGNIPREILKGKREKGHCKVVPNQSRWSCSMPKVSIGSFTYNNIHPAYFQLAEKYITVPRDFMLFLIDFVFSKSIKEGKCADINRRMITCKDSAYIAHLPDIKFTFDNYTYSINTSALFEPIVGIPHLSMYINNYNEDNCWIIGDRFLQYFDSVFDYEKGIVELYSNDVTIEELIANSSYMKTWLYCVLVLLMVLGIGIEIYQMIKNSNNITKVLH